MDVLAFSELESMLADNAVRAFSNIALTTGVASCTAVLDRNVERLGEYGQFAESRDRLTFSKASAPPLAVGVVLTADPAVYSAAQRLAMPVSSWTLDELESDDGLVAVWWTR